jgi:hypothetical protein
MSNHCFVGEDRNFGGSELFVDLIPKSCWFTNVRYCVDKEDWDKIRKIVYKRAGYICECCKVNCIESKIPIEAHERWNYDYDTKIQKLVRIIALCKKCHQSTHLGFAKINGKEKEALEHLKLVRNFDLEQLREHVDVSYAIWSEKNQHSWNLDLDLITLNGYNIVKPVYIQDRINIMEEKLNK